MWLSNELDMSAEWIRGYDDFVLEYRTGQEYGGWRCADVGGYEEQLECKESMTGRHVDGN